MRSISLRGLAAAAGLTVASLAGRTPALAQGLAASDAARTSLVLVPGVGLDYGSTGKGLAGFIWLGGRVDWLPRVPVVVTAGANGEIAGTTGWSEYELGAGYRFSESLRGGYEGVVTNVQQIAHGDSVRETFRYGETAVRHYAVLHAGLLHNTSVSLSFGASKVTTSSFYIGLSRNDLVSQQGGIMGHKVVRTTSLDLLLGSPDATAPKHNEIGGRLTFNFDWGNLFDTRFEFGLRPGLGGYGRFSINGYFMLTDILR